MSDELDGVTADEEEKKEGSEETTPTEGEETV